MVYNIPIAGKKEFNIRSGSYVEWTGNVMNPMLSISASEQVKATVVDGEQNRLVTFAGQSSSTRCSASSLYWP